MLIEISHWLVILALVTVFAKIFYNYNNNSHVIIINYIGLSLIFLIFSFLINDFSVKYIALNSNSQLNWYYKITALWGGHAGSWLLWVFFTSLVGIFFKIHKIKYYNVVLLGVLLLLIFIANPFMREYDILFDGEDLNPLLQDPLFLIHPPILYAGYISILIPFILQIKLLLAKKINFKILYYIKISLFAALGILTLGILLGSAWAYYELGWGGYWFWDPVENASLMPWLAILIASHTANFTLRFWFTSIAFCLVFLGTYLVRSGIVTSVHSFAFDNNIGLWYLLWFLILLASIIYIWFKNYKKINFNNNHIFDYGLYFSLICNILILLVILIGTLVPILSKNILLQPSFFNTLIGPLTGLAILGLISSYLKKIKNLSADISHLGLIVLLLGIGFNNLAKQEILLAAKPGLDQIKINKNYNLEFKKINPLVRANHFAEQAEISLYYKNKLIKSFYPELRYYFSRNQKISEGAIGRHYLNDFFIVLGEKSEQTGLIAINIFMQPCISLIYLGGLLICIGCFIFLVNRLKIRF